MGFAVQSIKLNRNSWVAQVTNFEEEKKNMTFSINSKKLRDGEHVLLFPKIPASYWFYFFFVPIRFLFRAFFAQNLRLSTTLKMNLKFFFLILTYFCKRSFKRVQNEFIV